MIPEFHTPINPFIIVALFLVALAIGSWSYWTLRGQMKRSYLLCMWLLRVASIIFLAVLMLQPYTLIKRPNPDNFKIEVFFDCSGSMRTKDRDNTSRLERLKKFAMSSLANRLKCNDTSPKHIETRVFSDKCHQWFGNDLSILPGNTALGDALLTSAEDKDSLETGAILVVTDGNSNTGTDPMAAAKSRKAQAIPISCVGIGSSQITNDVLVKAAPRAFSVQKGVSGTKITALVENRFDKKIKTTLMMMKNGVVMDQMPVSVDPRSEISLSFPVKFVQPGRQVVTLKLKDVPGDTKPENNLDYVIVDVEDPDIFHILYLGAHPLCLYRFLAIHTRRDEQFKLSAIIKLGDKKYFHVENDEDGKREVVLEKGFPEGKGALNPFDIVILDSSVGPLLSEQSCKPLQEFVERRGGGLLCVGSSASLPQELSSMLPIRQMEETRFNRRRFLEIEAPFIFSPDRTELLRSPPGPWLAAGSRVYFSRELKPGARSALSIIDNRAKATTTATKKTKNGVNIDLAMLRKLSGINFYDRDIVMAVQQYGAGRVAWLGTEATWRWFLNDNESMERYMAFWNHSLVWLGSVGKPRLKLDFEGKRLNMDQENIIAADVLSADYSSALDASVSAEITSPDGKTTTRDFTLSIDNPGRYLDTFIPSTAGEYHVRVTAAFPDGEKLEKKTVFLATPMGLEAEDTRYRPEILQDVARITNGAFWDEDSLPTTIDLPVSANVPVKVKKYNWANSWWALILILATIATEWYLRRRVGLK